MPRLLDNSGRLPKCHQTRSWTRFTVAVTVLLPVLPVAWLAGLCCDVAYDAPLGQYALGLAVCLDSSRR